MFLELGVGGKKNQKKGWSPCLISFKEKKSEDFTDFLQGKITLKIRICNLCGV